ncbi:Rpn family recombination-promoting nuclease/putative transposase [Anabaena cylindrica]|uniref:Rpn family recombination-promoting nuclease/putative transposase n=1 Tax=Anabaena cylindrica TaxID=1165 RepID=UPI0003176AFF|nr:Rpn family recombination-promoting nuclease/putative transposase [Anabaena cylindrica]
MQKTDSELVQQTTFTLEETCHRFQVIRLWEQPTETFLQTPGLLPFAVLSNTGNKVNTLQEVATAIDNIPDKQMQSSLAASAFILAGLVLEKEVIQRLLRRDIMRESVTYQLLVEEGREEGRKEGRKEGREEGREEAVQLVAVNMLKEGMSIEFVAKVTGLTFEQVQQLQATNSGD